MSGIADDDIRSDPHRSGTSQSQPGGDLEKDGVHLEWECVSDLSVFSQVTATVTAASCPANFLCGWSPQVALDASHAAYQNGAMPSFWFREAIAGSFVLSVFLSVW
jgi:hypothetical protein